MRFKPRPSCLKAEKESFRASRELDSRLSIRLALAGKNTPEAIKRVMADAAEVTA